MSWIFWRKSPVQLPATSRCWEKIEEFKDLPVKLLIAFYCSDDKSDGFVIFLNYENDVDYKTKGGCDSRIEDDKCGKVLSRIAVLEAVPIYHLNEAIKLAFRAMLGEGLARAMHEDHANAKTILDAANKFVSARNQETGRRWFLISAGLTTSLIIYISGLIWLHRESWGLKWGSHLIPIVIGAAAGAVGSFFSLLSRAAKIPLDPAAGRFQHYLEGMGHIVAGMIGAIFVYFAMKTGIFAPKLLEIGLTGQVLGCMAGGASERLVPTIIKKVDVTKADPKN